MSEPESNEPQPVPLRFCEPHKLREEILTLKSLPLSRATYDDVARPVLGLMTRGFTHRPAKGCDNHDIHGLCLGHPDTDGSTVEPLT